jgi:hypothetical protein
MKETIEMLLRAREELFSTMNDIDIHCNCPTKACLRCAIEDIEQILRDIDELEEENAI